MEYLIRQIKRSSNSRGMPRNYLTFFCVLKVPLKYEHVFGMTHHLEIPSTSKYLGHPNFHNKKTHH